MSRWHQNGERTYAHYYDGSYYEEQGATTAAGPSSYRGADRYPPRSAIGKPKRTRQEEDSSSITSGTRDPSPPSKVARRKSADGRRTTEATCLPKESPALRRIPRPNLLATLQRLTEVWEGQYDATKQRMDAEVNCAKYERFRGRDDISKENKAKVEKAFEEVDKARDSEKAAREAVVARLESLTNQLMSYSAQTSAGVYEDLSGQTARAVRQTPPRQGAHHVSVQNSPNLRIPQTPPRTTIGKSSDYVATEPSVDSAIAGQDVQERAKKARSLSRKKLEELESLVHEVKMDSEDRLNQFESIIKDLVMEEVRNHVRSARDRKDRRQMAAAQATLAGQEGREGQTTEQTTGQKELTGEEVDQTANARMQGTQQDESDRVTETVATEQTWEGEFEPGKIRQTRKEVSVQSVDTVGSPAKENTTSAMIRREEDREPYLSLEQVNSMLQSLRQEFDTKLHAQEIHQRQEREGMMRLLHEQMRGAADSTSFALSKHYEILSNHRDTIHRHERLWQSTVSLFNSIPKPND